MNNTIDVELAELFLDLIRIDAVSGKEKPVADYIRLLTASLGFPAEEDGAATLSGGNSGNIIVPIHGGGDFLLMAHMDTPRSTKGVQPQLLSDRITSDGTTILGVDDRGGISAILWALKQAVKQEKTIKPCTLLFSVCEETTLAGSMFYQPSAQMTHGFVFDSHLPPGKFVSETCGAIAFKIKVKGRASHAGVAPEKGVNAIQIAAEGMRRFPFGRIDACTTANIGIIGGGTATNVVPDGVELEGEIRTDYLDQGEQMMQSVIADFEAAAAKFGGSVECSWLWDFKPYHISADSVPYKRMEALCRHLSLDMEGVKSMGGSDANNMNAKRLPTINLGVGAQNPHGTDEFILYKDLQMSATMALALLTEI